MNSTINGVRVPYELSTAELAALCRTGSMQDFTVAAEALGAKEDDAAFHVLASYLSDRDAYKRLCVFNVIGNTRYASEITNEIESALSSPAALFRRAALRIAAQENVTVSEERVKSALWQNDAAVDADVYSAAETLSASDENYAFMTALGGKRIKNGVNILGLTPLDFSVGKPAESVARAVAEHGFDVARFQNDADGHVRQRLK